MKKNLLLSFSFLLACLVPLTSLQAGHGKVSGNKGGAPSLIRITEFMYDGHDDEFVELTNVGLVPVDMTGWSYDDNHETPGVVSLSDFGIVQPGESVILSENSADDFRTAWGLCANIKVIGDNSTNLGRGDEINIYDADNNLVDQLTFGDQDIPGSIRTQNFSGYVTAEGLGNNDITKWVLSAAGDGEGSFTSAGGDVGSPGQSKRATVAFHPCLLPLDFEYFNAQRAGADINLNWKNATPATVGTYSIMRSDNGVDFSRIATIQASASQPLYNYTDVKVPGNKLYYRIDAKELTGRIVSSPVRIITANGINGPVTTYPNPVSNGYFTIIGNATGKKSVTIYNSTGALCKQLTFGESSATVETSNWAKGVYLVRIATGNNVVTKKIIVQ